eukprot:15432706-Alexandrium_andersonii.AAC.1
MPTDHPLPIATLALNHDRSGTAHGKHKRTKDQAKPNPGTTKRPPFRMVHAGLVSAITGWRR